MAFTMTDADVTNSFNAQFEAVSAKLTTLFNQNNITADVQAQVLIQTVNSCLQNATNFVVQRALTERQITAYNDKMKIEKATQLGNVLGMLATANAITTDNSSILASFKESVASLNI